MFNDNYLIPSESTQTSFPKTLLNGYLNPSESTQTSFPKTLLNGYLNPSKLISLQKLLRDDTLKPEGYMKAFNPYIANLQEDNKLYFPPEKTAFSYEKLPLEQNFLKNSPLIK